MLMTVNPGFGGQKYIESSTRKIKTLRNRLNEEGREMDIEVDGGVTSETIDKVLDAGANVIVMGSAIFRGNAAENTKYFKNRMLAKN